MNADAFFAVGQVRDACRIIDFRGLRVIDGKGFDLSNRQIFRDCRHRRHFGKTGAFGKIFKVKALHKPVPGTRDDAEVKHQP